MSLVKITSDGITDGSIVNADLHSAANIASSKLADSGVSAGSYGSATAIPAITLNAKGIVTSVSTNSVNTTTNLGISTSTTAVTVTSSTGDNAAISEASGSAAGVMSVAHHDKLDGIESSATADQTAAEIRALVESASDSNVFTDADHTKLNGIEASATADQSNSEIKTAYEANSNTNAFTDALLSKLNGIAASATNVTNNNQLTNGAGYTTFDGNYNSLSNRPTIPTNNNQLTNGAGYITSATNNFVSSASFNTGNGVLTLNRSGLGTVTVDLDGRYSTSSVSTSQLAKAFVNFDQRSSQSIRNSYNVSSLTDNGTGKTTVNFSSGVGSNPTIQATSSWGDGSRAGWCGLTPSHTPNSSNCRIFSQQPSTYAFMDAVFLCVTVHRS